MCSSRYVYKLSMLIYQLSESCCYIAKNIISSSRFVGLVFCAVGKYFLCSLEKVRKATIIVVMSVCLSVCLSVRSPTRPQGTTRLALDGYSQNLIFQCFLKNSSRKSKFYYNRTRIKSTLHEDQYTFSIISLSVLLRIKKYFRKICRESQKTHFIFNDFFRKSCCLWDNVEKYYIAGLAKDGTVAHEHCMLDT